MILEGRTKNAAGLVEKVCPLGEWQGCPELGWADNRCRRRMTPTTRRKDRSLDERLMLDEHLVVVVDVLDARGLVDVHCYHAWSVVRAPPRLRQEVVAGYAPRP